MDKFITPYIQKHVIKNAELADSLKFELDRRIYHFGNHFKVSAEHGHLTKKMQWSLLLREQYLKLKVHLFNKANDIPGNSVVSNAYISRNQIITSKRLHFIRPPWDPSLKQEMYVTPRSHSIFLEMKKFLASANFNQLLNTDSINKMHEIQAELSNFYSHKNIAAGLFPNDVGFFESQSIYALKKVGKPSMVLIHGIPAVYSKNIYRRGDYLLVWGKGLKDIFVRNGLPPDKVKVIGHPLAGRHPTKLISTLDSILVLGAPIPGSQHDRENPVLQDRGNIIFYCYLIQQVLSKLGIKEVRLRPHPSENKNWYTKFIDNEFFKMDESASISEATRSSTLVIGPSSSSSMEALAEGVNYIIFEPFCTDNGNSQYELVAPFDGSEKRLLIAKTTDELCEIIKNNRLCNPQILQDFFDESYHLDQTLSELL